MTFMSLPEVTEIGTKARTGAIFDLRTLCGVTATLLEWDDKIPSFREVHDEALKANEFIDGATAAQAEKRANPPRAPVSG